ncbi:MAG TPA: flagellar hook-length control protein FliK, partial [Chondromyces sp.]|nr:flagellar hook-length control protein FliK [Chondromyces sp.]
LQKAFSGYVQSTGQTHSGKIEQSVRTMNQESMINGQSYFQPLAKAEQFTLFVQINQRPMNFQQFTEQFSQILGKSSFTKAIDGNRLLIKLYPEQLGSLRIELLQQNGGLTAKIITSTHAVKDLLDQQLQSLKHAFIQQNITVEKIEISFGQTDLEKFNHSSQQQPSDREKPQQEKQENSEENQQESFKELLVNMEA